MRIFWANGLPPLWQKIARTTLRLVIVVLARNLLSSTKRLSLPSIPESEGLSTAESDDCGYKKMTKQTIKYCDISSCKTLLVTR